MIRLIIVESLIYYSIPDRHSVWHGQGTLNDDDDLDPQIIISYLWTPLSFSGPLGVHVDWLGTRALYHFHLNLHNVWSTFTRISFNGLLPDHLTKIPSIPNTSHPNPFCMSFKLPISSHINIQYGPKPFNYNHHVWLIQKQVFLFLTVQEQKSEALNSTLLSTNSTDRILWINHSRQKLYQFPQIPDSLISDLIITI